jgi:hypothetical protein
MLKALAYSMCALDSASELDLDRTDDDRTFFAAEKKTLGGHFDTLFEAENELEKFAYLTVQQWQSHVVIGDAVLDRAVRAGKQKMKQELKYTAPLAADEAFPADIRDIVDAERHVEPDLVLQVAGRFEHAPEFASKEAIKEDLEKRANRQKENFAGRTKAQLAEDTLEAKVASLVAKSSDALYGLEKRMLDRFKRETGYVREFFLDVASKRKKPGEEGGPPG